MSDFGTVALGQELDRVPAGFTNNCDPQGVLADCVHKDAAGIVYWVDRREVVRKDVIVDTRAPAGMLPFGLTPQDGVPEVMRKLRMRDNAPALRVMTFNDSRGTQIISDWTCNAIGQQFIIDVVFGPNGAVTQITATVGQIN